MPARGWGPASARFGTRLRNSPLNSRCPAPATLALVVGPSIYNANIELVEEAFPLSGALGTSTDVTHEDILYPGRTRTCIRTRSADRPLGRWNFDLDIQEQASAVPALDDLGKWALFIALLGVASLAAGRCRLARGAPGALKQFDVRRSLAGSEWIVPLMP